MAISAVGTFGNTSGSGITTISITTVNVGDAVLFGSVISSTSRTISSISSSNTTGWVRLGSATSDTTMGCTTELWLGTVTSVGTATITVTPSASVSGLQNQYTHKQFTAGLGSGTVWAVDNSQTASVDVTTNSTTLVFPTLTATGTGRLYYGFNVPQFAGTVPGASSGWAYNTDAFTDVIAYNVNAGSGSVTAPSGSQSPTGRYIRQAALLTATSGTQTVTATGIASAEAFGTSSVGRGAVTVTASGIASAESFGTLSVAQAVTASSIASAEAFGSLTVTVGPLTVLPSGISSAEAFGTSSVTIGSTQSVTASGIPSGEVFGSATVTAGAALIVVPGIASAEGFGTAALSGAQFVSPSGIASASAFGTASVSDGAPGVSFLPRVLSGAKLAVEIAWGADLSGDPESWAWTDVTELVREDPGISVTRGRNDEASKTNPATCSIILDNSSGGFSLGPQSPNYPFVRRNTPVRVSVDPGDGGGPRVVFQGGANGFTPSWDISGRIPVVELSASGTLRRLIQGSAPLVSSMRRGLVGLSNLVAYWPCEDGKNATRISSGINKTPMTFSGVVKFADSDDFECSAPLPTLNGSVLYGDVAAYTPPANGMFSARALVVFPPANAPAANGSVILRGFTSGTVARADLVYGTGGTLELRMYDRFDTLLYTVGPIGFNVDGGRRRVSFSLQVTSGFVEAGINTLEVGQPGDVGFGEVTTIASTAAALGVATKIVVNPSRSLTDTAIGHISVETGGLSLSVLRDQLNAYAGEDPTNRLIRVCSENGVVFDYEGFADGSSTLTDQMGPQSLGDLVGTLREAEAAGQGVLADGISPGLFYLTRRRRESQDAALVIDATQLAPSFDPVDDDQRTTNKATVTRTSGASATFEDSDGPMGTSAIGIYDTSATISTYFDESALLYAGWLVSQGTTTGYRYPTVTVDLMANPELAADWLNVRPGSRIDVTGISDVMPEHPSGTISLMVEGVTQNLSTRGGWRGVAKCSPFDIWRIATYAEDAPDGDEWVGRADGTGSLTTSSVTSASTSMTVSGSVWVDSATYPDEFPFDVEVAGQRVTVTAITGGTFTISASEVVGSIPSGATVQLWAPTLPGL